MDTGSKVMLLKGVLCEGLQVHASVQAGAGTLICS